MVLLSSRVFRCRNVTDRILQQDFLQLWKCEKSPPRYIFQMFRDPQNHKIHWFLDVKIGTSRYTGFSFFFGCLLVSIAIFPMKHQMKPRLSQNKTSWPGVRTEIIIRTQQTQGSSRGGFMSHITPKRDPRPYRLVHWQTVEHGYSSEECGGNHEPRSFLSGYRFFCELQRKYANWTSQVFRITWVSWDISTATLVYQRVKLLLDWLEILIILVIVSVQKSSFKKHLRWLRCMCHLSWTMG